MKLIDTAMTKVFEFLFNSGNLILAKDAKDMDTTVINAHTTTTSVHTLRIDKRDLTESIIVEDVISGSIDQFMIKTDDDVEALIEFIKDVVNVSAHSEYIKSDTDYIKADGGYIKADVPAMRAAYMSIVDTLLMMTPKRVGISANFGNDMDVDTPPKITITKGGVNNIPTDMTHIDLPEGVYRANSVVIEYVDESILYTSVIRDSGGNIVTNKRTITDLDKIGSLKATLHGFVKTWELDGRTREEYQKDIDADYTAPKVEDDRKSGLKAGMEDEFLEMHRGIQSWMLAHDHMRKNKKHSVAGLPDIQHHLMDPGERNSIGVEMVPTDHGLAVRAWNREYADSSHPDHEVSLYITALSTSYEPIKVWFSNTGHGGTDEYSNMTFELDSNLDELTKLIKDHFEDIIGTEFYRDFSSDEADVDDAMGILNKDAMDILNNSGSKTGGEVGVDSDVVRSSIRDVMKMGKVDIDFDGPPSIDAKKVSVTVDDLEAMDKEYFAKKALGDSDVAQSIKDMDKVADIKRALSDIEEKYDVKILYACESGSRAWGFESVNSDWDVRFIYIHKKEHYLSVTQGRDVIEESLPGDLDIAGWDFKKTMGLLNKGNPALMEWLISPIVYIKPSPAIQQILSDNAEWFSPVGSINHYLHMAGGNWHRYLENKDSVKLKKYLYVIRPLLASQWIWEKGTQPPMEFDEVIKIFSGDSSVKTEIDHLIDEKRSGEELGESKPYFALNEWIQSTLADLDDKAKNGKLRGPSMPDRIGVLDKYFLAALDE